MDDRISRAVCAGLAVANSVYGCFAALLGVVALIGVDEAHPTEGRILLGGAAILLSAAVWAAALAWRGPASTSTLSGALAGVVLVVSTFLLFYQSGLASPLRASTALALVLVTLQVAGVPAMFWLIRRSSRLRTGQAGSTTSA